MRYRIDIEYQGTRYSGWQVQPNARTVQGELQKAVEEAFGPRRYDLQGSGRTDAGVHAMRQTAHLELPERVRPSVLVPRLNDLLPADINVLGAVSVPEGWHARHDALGRSYVYQIARRRTAFGKKLVWWIKDPLDAGAMREAAAHFLGLHDFAGFTAHHLSGPSVAGHALSGGRGQSPRPPGAKETRVKVEAAQVEEIGDLLTIRVAASHFLWKMVRQMIGVLVEVGRGRLAPDRVRDLIRKPSDVPAKLTAPPSGLFLEGAWYKGEEPLYERPLKPLLRLG